MQWHIFHFSILTFDLLPAVCAFAVCMRLVWIYSTLVSMFAYIASFPRKLYS